MAAPITLFERRACAIKTEVTYGTDPVPTGAANTMQVIEGSVRIVADKVTRNLDRTYLGARPFNLVKRRAEFEGQVELCGAAAPGSGTPLDAILRACSFGLTSVGATSDTFAPVSGSFSSSAIYFEWAGLLFKITGFRGAIEVSQEIDARTMATVRGMGLIELANVTEAAIAGLTYTAFQNPPIVTKDTWALTVGGVAVNATSLRWSQGQAPELFHGSELREVSYTGREITGTLTMFKELFATLNPFTQANGETTVAMVSTLTGGAGKNLAMSFPAVQFEYPQPTSINGAAGYEIPFVAIPGASGNDEVSLAFT
jgi:hypothetical protein